MAGLLIKVSCLEGVESFNQRKTNQIVLDLQWLKSLEQTFNKLATSGSSLGLFSYLTD